MSQLNRLFELVGKVEWEWLGIKWNLSHDGRRWVVDHDARIGTGIVRTDHEALALCEKAAEKKILDAGWRIEKQRGGIVCCPPVAVGLELYTDAVTGTDTVAAFIVALESINAKAKG